MWVRLCVSPCPLTPSLTPLHRSSHATSLSTTPFPTPAHASMSLPSLVDHHQSGARKPIAFTVVDDSKPARPKPVLTSEIAEVAAERARSRVGRQRGQWGEPVDPFSGAIGRKSSVASLATEESSVMSDRRAPPRSMPDRRSGGAKSPSHLGRSGSGLANSSSSGGGGATNTAAAGGIPRPATSAGFGSGTTRFGNQGTPIRSVSRGKVTVVSAGVCSRVFMYRLVGRE